MHCGNRGNLTVSDRNDKAAHRGAAGQRGINHSGFAIKGKKSIGKIVGKQMLRCQAEGSFPFSIREERNPEEYLHQHWCAQIQRLFGLMIEPCGRSRIGQRL